MKKKYEWLLLAAALPFLTLASGCAEEREPINRVQANALAKSFYVGTLATPSDDPEFYTAATVIDVPYGADQGGVFPGLVGQLFRIKWEITEDYLNARLTYENIDGVDGHGAKKSGNGKVIASYSIADHFDIRHAYNPSTGEENNVIEENKSDRPWYSREYFRVDWSINHIATSQTWDPLSDDGFEVEPLAYYVSDPSHPDAPHFASEEGYFDVTNKLHLKPRMLDLGGGPAPACFYYGHVVNGGTYPWGNCENSEITVRFAYKRIAHEGEPGFSDYEPIDWDGSRMNAAGVFTRDRLGWDRSYGIVDEKWRRFAQRYNIWSASHTDRECALPATTALGCNPTRDTGDIDCDGKPDPIPGADGTAFFGPNGTDDECEDGKNWGSKCDALVGKCTIPFSKRTTRPVPWYYTLSPDDLTIFESTEFATWQWDAAMRVAVQSARYAECMRTGTASLIGTARADQFIDSSTSTLEIIRARCGELFPIDQSYDDAELDSVRDVNICMKAGGSHAECTKELSSAAVGAMPAMVLMCRNPVTATDAPGCGKVGTAARPGDIRYHQLNVWPTRHSSSPWGYGPSLSDPLTGEIISAGINVYNAVTDSAAQGFLDQIRWMNGELSAGDITSGKHVHDWVQATEYGNAQMGPLLTREDIAARIGGLAGAHPGAGETAQIDPTLLTKFAKVARDLDREVLPPGVIPEDRSVFEQRVAMAKETGVEAELMNPMWLQMAGVDPDHAEDVQLEMASPLRGMSSRQLLKAYDDSQARLADRGQCILGAPEPTGIPAVAKMMKAKFPFVVDADPVAQQERLSKMWDYLRFKMHYTVILHEMGHTIGLRHNFVSSYDKYNYKTQYWQLRTGSGTVKKICNGPTADGADCIGPRYHDPLTQDELDNSIWTWMQTTVMDYAGDLTQDMIGLGAYDMAATRMFYGDVVDVRADLTLPPDGEAPSSEEERRAASVASMVDYPGYLFGQIVNCPQGNGGCSLSANNGLIGHYSFYNEAFKLVQPERCVAVNPEPPSWWDGDKWGTWDALWDGHVVHNERCTRPPVDFVEWNQMVPDNVVVDFDDSDYFTPRRAKDAFGRPRVPYGFLTDNQADGWSPSAYRHDNGADMYEAMVFHSNLYENRHIFDNFRNGRVNFTVYGAYQRALARYHTKVQNLTQGFAYAVDFILREFAKNVGAKFADVVATNTGEGSFLYDHAVAASIGFDHFTRVMTRPHPGAHFCRGQLFCDPKGDRVLRPAEDEIGGIPQGNVVAGNIPNGNMIAGNSVAYGGRPINNDFQYAHGHWTFNYLNQAGSYYEKTFAVQSMLEASYGAINFFRFDGLDARFRHVNYGDLFPDGIRRFLGLALTEDAQVLGARITSNSLGAPKFAELPDAPEGAKFPVDPMAWLSFVPEKGPVACAPVGDVLSCVDSLGVPIANQAGPQATAWFVDPQLGYEVQKFIVFWYYVYQPASEMLDWVDLLRIYRLGSDTNPDYLPEQLVEWVDPESGLRYLAKRFGDETIFGKVYDKGLAAKMIQWANTLTGQVYELDKLEPFDPVTGAPNVKFVDGAPVVLGGSKDDNPKWQQLRRYRGLIDFTRDTASKLGFPEPALQIISP
ncbi:MAG: hypothetical protein EXR75_04780 [Myxococcales bacterium]|nr:hypothetical protein [Myxococcales bacterium]